MKNVKRCLQCATVVVSFAALFIAEPTWAQKKSLPTIPKVSTSKKTFTYDVSASTGTNNGKTYTELNLGLNAYLADWINWRNALFSRQGAGIKTVQGLDSSLLLGWQVFNQDRDLGFQAYVGPGLRLASDKNNAATADAGVIVTLGGIKLGAGAKALSYFEKREDLSGDKLKSSELQYYFVISGGGGL